MFFAKSFIKKYTDSQKKVEVIARKRIQNFMLALGNLIIIPFPPKSKFCGLIFEVGG